MHTDLDSISVTYFCIHITWHMFLCKSVNQKIKGVIVPLPSLFLWMAIFINIVKYDVIFLCHMITFPVTSLVM